MPLFNKGGSVVTDVRVGSTQAKAVYMGSTLVWPVAKWTFTDDFERTAIGTTNWTSGGVVIAGTAPNRYLQKDSNNGTSSAWTIKTFSGDQLEVECRLGTWNDSQQVCSVNIGNPNGAYAYVEFSRSVLRIGYTSGTGDWNIVTTPSVIYWANGDTITFKRVGTVFSLYRNGTYIANGTCPALSSVTANHVGFSLRRASNILGTYYGPTIDVVKVASY